MLAIALNQTTYLRPFSITVQITPLNKKYEAKINWKC